jgi:hypothetical protein
MRPSLAAITKFRSWFHAGEEGALAVYTKPYRMNLVIQSVGLLAFWAVFPVLQGYSLGLMSIAAYALPRVVAEGRRAIVFSDSEFIYRPPFAPPVRVPFVQVLHFRRSKVTVSYLLRLGFVNGIIVTLVEGSELAFPLDFKERDEILQRLISLTGKAIDE